MGASGEHAGGRRGQTSGVHRQDQGRGRAGGCGGGERRRCGDDQENRGERHRRRRTGRGERDRGTGRRSHDGRERGRLQCTTGDARSLALEALTKVRRDDAFANLVLPTLLERVRLERRDAAFATALTYGTLRLRGRYDAVLSHCVDRPLGQLDDDVLDILRLGAHQLMGMRVPTHAAVSSTVDLASDAAGRGAAAFVNAVLRRVCERDLDAWLAQLRADAPDEAGALAAVESHPLWVVKAMRQALLAQDRPVEELADLLHADNTDPEVALCARPGLVSPEHLAKEAGSVTSREPRPGDVSPCAVVLTGGDPGRIRAVRESRAGVEDEGSQLVALMLADAPLKGRDERWLDLCAGPGGKAALLGARALQRGARLVANETAPHRARLIETCVRALPRDVVAVRRGDGRRFGHDEPAAWDRVLVDAPCSGLGSLRRRPEARWRRTAKDVNELAELQRELLTSALATVRPGGVVAYTTCSPHVLETEYVVRDVTRRLDRRGQRVEVLHAGNAATRLAPRPPAGTERRMLQLWPHLEGTDAMFCALLRRVD